MVKRRPLILLTPLLGILLFFQNCDSYHSKGNKRNESSLSDLNMEALEKKIWTVNKLNIASKAVILYVNPSIFDDQASFDWYYQLSENPSACTVTNHQDYENAVEIDCDNPGELNVTLSVIDSKFKIEELNYSTTIEPSPSSMPSDADIYYSSEELLVALDGTTQTPETPSESGSQLYAHHCGRCHNQHPATVEDFDAKNRNFNELLADTKDRIRPAHQMSNVSASNAELRKIVEAILQ